MADVAERGGWRRRFDEPIPLPDGRKLVTLKGCDRLAGERNS
jgi:hypothetical protein